jgi:hypothetical protein
MTWLCRVILCLLIRRVVRKGIWAHKQRVERFDGSRLFYRFDPFWPDEWVNRRTGKHHHRPPWWRPFNVLLHRWCPSDDTGEGMHDHPRWSITICLRGKMIEHTPWGDKVLTPGSIVVRSRKYIHSFSIPKGYSGRTWTLFIVGRRNYPQNTYIVTTQGVVAHGSAE